MCVKLQHKGVVKWKEKNDPFNMFLQGNICGYLSCCCCCWLPVQNPVPQMAVHINNQSSNHEGFLWRRCKYPELRWEYLMALRLNKPGTYGSWSDEMKPLWPNKSSSVWWSNSKSDCGRGSCGQKGPLAALRLDVGQPQHAHMMVSRQQRRYSTVNVLSDANRSDSLLLLLSDLPYG